MPFSYFRFYEQYDTHVFFLLHLKITKKKNKIFTVLSLKSCTNLIIYYLSNLMYGHLNINFQFSGRFHNLNYGFFSFYKTNLHLNYIIFPSTQINLIFYTLQKSSIMSPQFHHLRKIFYYRLMAMQCTAQVFGYNFHSTPAPSRYSTMIFS